jgi:hypothetical protein
MAILDYFLTQTERIVEYLVVLNGTASPVLNILLLES